MPALGARVPLSPRPPLLRVSAVPLEHALLLRVLCALRTFAVNLEHALLERARNVLGWQDAAHAETDPEAARPVVHALPCSLVEVSETIRLAAGSHLAAIYGVPQIREGYRCSYGVNPAFQDALFGGSLRACAHGEDGSIRALEATDHPFFIATLFQPERKALAGIAVPLAEALLSAAFRHQSSLETSRETRQIGSPA